MKKILITLFALISFYFSANAQTISVDGITYTLNQVDKTASCDGLSDIYATWNNLIIPDFVEYGGEKYAVTSIGDSAFNGYSGIMGSLTIGNNVTSIGEYAFCNCSRFTGNLVIPNSVTSIGNDAFNNCYGFTGDLVIPNSVTSIGDNAFYKCRGFTGSLTIPNSVTSIGKWAFYNCKGFTGDLVIGNSVTLIDDLAFGYCSGFSNVKSYNIAPPICYNSSFYNWKMSDFTIYVPIGYKSDYQSVSPWKEFGKIIDNLPNPNYAETVIGNITYLINISNNTAVCTGLAIGSNISDITIKNEISYEGKTYTVQSILDDAFFNCTGLTGTLIIEDGISAIGNNAFSGCTALKEVVLPPSISSIGTSAFYNCKSLIKSAYPNSINNPFPSGESLAYSTKNVVFDNGVIYNGDKTTLYYIPMSFNGRYDMPSSVQTIGNNAFYGCSLLTSVSVSDKVTVIPSNAFKGCGNLTTITLPSALITIGEYAFYGCSKLDSITIPSSVTTLADNAFNGCTGLKSISIPANVTTVGQSAFSRCTSLTELHVDDSATAVTFGANCFASAPVTTLYMGRNWTCNSTSSISTALKTVTLSDKVTYIPAYAFKGCVNITGFDIPTSVKSIGEYAFNGCTGLSSVLIPPYVTNIGIQAFGGCTGLVKSAYPDAIPDPFSNGYTVPYVAGDVTVEDGMIYNSSKNALYYVPTNASGDFVIADGVQTIGENAFIGCNLITGITFPTTVVSIGKSAFNDCNKITSITVKDGTTAISFPDNCFASAPVTTLYMGRNWTCGNSTSSISTALKTVTLGDKVTSIPAYAFKGCVNITGFDIPTTVKSIGEYAFNGCTGLSSVLIPPYVTNIGIQAFGGCTGLKSISIPASVTTVGQSAFSGCTSLTELHVDDSATAVTFGANCFASAPVTTLYMGRNWTCGNSTSSISTALKTVTLSDKVTSIPAYAFKGCVNITGFEIPTTVKSIGEYAFNGCTGLKSINIPANVTTVGQSAFSGCISLAELHVDDSATAVTFGANCFASAPVTTLYMGRNWTCGNSTSPISTALKTVTLGDKVTSIPAYAFSGCTGLNTIQLVPGIVTIGAHSFKNCRSLSEIVLPLSLREIEEGTFAGCSSLHAIDIPDNVSSIGISAFENCSGLTSVTIPAAVTELDYSVFAGCSSLAEITFEDSDTPINIAPGTFADCPLQALYMGRNWTYGNNSTPMATTLRTVVFGEKVTAIPTYAFYNCAELGEIAIPAAVTTIGSNAFDGCDSLKRLVYNATLCSSFGDKVFPPTIEKLNIGSNVTMIPANFLGRGNKLKVIELPNSVASIGNYAFIDSYDLKSLYIGTGIRTINRLAFYDINDNNLHHEYTIPKIFWLGNTPPSGTEYLKGMINYVSNTQYQFDNYKQYQYLSSKFEVNGVVYVPLRPSDRTCDVIDCTYGTENAFISIPKIVVNQGIELSVKDISDYAFYDNDTLEQLALANNGSIGDYAFYSCQNLPDVVLPNSITGVGAHCFQNCEALATVSIGQNIPSLPEYVFAGCGLLANLSVPANIEQIGDYAVEGCKSLSSLRLEESYVDRDNDGSFDEQVISLGSNGTDPLFKDCPLETVFIGRRISYNADESYGYSPFYDCKTLVSAEITDRETQVYDYEFYSCSNLRTLLIGNGVVQIGRWAFSRCSSLEFFSAGSQVSTIGEEAFSDCTGMTEYYSYSQTPPVCGDQALDDINKWSCILYVPAECKDEYEVADQWMDFFFINEMERVAVESVTLNRVELTIDQGESFTLIATVNPTNATNKDLAWSSSDMNVAKVSSIGVVTALKAGTTVITARSADGVEASCNVTVLPSQEETIYVTINKTAIRLAVGSTETLTATVSPESAAALGLEWSSDNDAVATVDASGLVTARSAGIAIITVTCGDAHGQCEVTVEKTDGLDTPAVGQDSIDVYTLQGVVILKNCTEEDLKQLLPGYYIINRSGKVEKIKR